MDAGCLEASQLTQGCLARNVVCQTYPTLLPERRLQPHTNFLGSIDCDGPLFKAAKAVLVSEVRWNGVACLLAQRSDIAQRKRSA
jgi:hypothetical protein